MNTVKTARIAGLFVVMLLCAAAIFGRSEPYVYLNLQPTYAPDDEIRFDVGGRDISKLDMKLIRVDLEEVFLKSTVDGRARDLSGLELEKAKTIDEWEENLPPAEDRYTAHASFTLKNPGIGAYVLQAASGETVGLSMFLVTGIAAVAKADSDNTVIFVADSKTGAPLTGASVKIISAGELLKGGATDDSGLARFDGMDGNTEKPVVIEWDGNPAIMNFYGYGNNNEEYRFYAYTDRPVYRPGQKVNLKGIIRKMTPGGEYSVPSGEVEIVISDPRGNEVSKQKVEMEKLGFGTFSTDYELGENCAVGHYSVRVSFGERGFYHSFQVEEYRKPEYEITVTPSKPTIVNGDSLSFTVDAKYYFGEPVKAANVKYTVYSRPNYWTMWKHAYSWYFDEGMRYPGYYGRGENIQEGMGTTDDQGRFTVIVQDTKVDGNRLYTLEATVTEKGRRAITGAGSAKVMQAEFNVSVRTDRYVADPGDRVWITTRAEDHEGNPVSRAFTLEIIRYEYKKDEKGEWGRHETRVQKRTIETSSEGISKTPFTPDMPGSFTIEVSGADRRDNRVTASAHLYVPGEGRRYWWSSGGDIEIIVDKDQYSRGDMARLLINTPYENAYALVTVEGTDLLGSEVVKLENGSGVYEFVITKAHQPNVTVSVSLINDNRLVQGQAEIVAPPVESFADITIESDKAEYKPGEKASVKVTAKDNEGRPLNVELSLGAVDESIYAIRPESTMDIRAAFYGRRYSQVRTQSSFWFHTYGHVEVMAVMEADMAGAVKDEAAPRMSVMKSMAQAAPVPGEMVQPEIRSDFPDTAYWMAHIETGADGEADVSFKMPDTLTTWRLTSRGISRETQVGETIHKVISTKNLLVRLQTPRFFTQGDEQNITAVVHNYLSAEKDVQAILNVKGLRLLEKNEKWLKVPAGGDVRVEWHAVVESPQDAWVTVKALTNEESDAMQLTIPVLPHGSPGGDAAAGELVDGGESETTFTLALPEGYLEDTEKLSINISPSLTSGMFDVLEYLAGYPYGCVEQTMSRFLPDVVIAELLQNAGLPLEGKLVELPKMVKDGLDRLADMQHNDGGWGWWKNDDTHPYMTAYVVMGLSHARRADYAVPDRMINGGVEALKEMLNKDDFEKFDEEDIWNTKAYMVYALAEAGVDAEQHAEKVYKNRDKLSDYGRAVLAIALSKFGKKDRALTLVLDLEKSAEISATSARWKGKTFKYRWSDNEIETTAFALMALVESGTRGELAMKAVRYLNVSRRGDHWYSTKDTAIAIMALTSFMKKYEGPNTNYTYTVTVNGSEVKSGAMKKEDVSGKGTMIEVTDGLKAGDNKIRITKNGRGTLYHFSALNYFEGSDFLDAQDNGIKVKRWYSTDANGEKRLEDDAVLKSGDVIWSHVKVDPQGAYDYVMVEDYLPSGFEVVKEQSGPGYPMSYRIGIPYYYVNREVRDEKVSFFYTRLWGRDYHTVTPLRAEVPGKVAAMPARAELMYFPEVGGRSAEAGFVVEE